MATATTWYPQSARLDTPGLLTRPNWMTAGKLLDLTDISIELDTWLEFWGPSDLAIHSMHMAKLLGDAPSAERSAREAFEAADPLAMPRNHAIYAVHLGSALAQVGKYDESIEVSRKVLSSNMADGSYRVRAELRETARTLIAAPYPAGREFAIAVRRLVPQP